ncbi:MAG TPA: DEAD/DEAH box helicase [Burkholderiales bacterium]|nr:DEAD/DEAH box helicase [Burkholderiales bacterium]
MQADRQEIVITTPFEGLGLSAALVRAVADQGYTEPTPIQTQAIPVVLAGRDLLAAAQTGTGKTAGFVLPMLQRLGAAAGTHRAVRALILVPTRELAAQVQQSVRTYGAHQHLRAAVIFGGVGINPQIAELRRGIEIVVATPGRLLDHVQQKTIDLSKVEILVLDEADRMLDMGFIPDIRRILALLPKQRQNLLFSATFPDEIRRLAAGFMHDPVTVEVARRNTPAELVAQVAHPVDAARKRELLAHLVKSNDWRQVLVFTRTKHGANRLAEQLERDGIEADAIHGNKSQNARTRALKRFKDNELRVLVATDIAARGLDIEFLPHVVNYDLPHVAEDYVHRIGRTGRAGSSGEAVSLVGHEERPLLAAIERLMNREVEKKIVPGFEPGTAPARPREPEHRPRREGPRQARPRRPARAAQGAHRPGRPNGDQRGELRPYRTEEYEAQLREARMRAREDAEYVPEPARPSQPQAPREPRRPVVTHKKQRAVLLGTPRREDNG